MLTWSLGCTGVLDCRSAPPTSWMARLLITSLTFMFDLRAGPGLPDAQREMGVKLAVDHLVADPRDQAAIQPGSRPAVPLASAAAFFT